MSDKISVTEFRSWLEGVLDFQPEGWTPDVGQWEKILEKIKQLDDTPPAPISAPQTPMKSNHPPQFQDTKNAGSAQGGDVVAPRNPRPQAPSVDMGQKVALPPEQPRKPKQLKVQSQGKPQVINDESGGKIVDTGKVYKTGEIDTSDGDYKSDFI